MEPFLSSRACVLLGLRAGPACGLQLIDRLAAHTGAVRPAQGSIYPALKHLEGEGLIRRLPPPSERRRGRARVDYELTIDGVRASDALRLSLQRLIRLGRRPLPKAPPEDARMRERVLASIELSGFAADLRRALEGSGRGRR
jgi:DNA-binding PadR family transcriptional regulator